MQRKILVLKTCMLTLSIQRQQKNLLSFAMVSLNIPGSILAVFRLVHVIFRFYSETACDKQSRIVFLNV